jgi:hypothetical protein
MLIFKCYGLGFDVVKNKKHTYEAIIDFCPTDYFFSWA